MRRYRMRPYSKWRRRLERFGFALEDFLAALPLGPALGRHSYRRFHRNNRTGLLPQLSWGPDLGGRRPAVRKFRRRSYRRIRLQLDTRVHPQDLLASLPLAAAIFWLPILAIVTTGLLSVGYDLRVLVWTSGCLTMAAGCAVNWLRCGRQQCRWLAPLFALGALTSLTYGVGLLPLGPAGWDIIGLGLLAGLFLAGAVPELLLGRYR